MGSETSMSLNWLPTENKDSSELAKMGITFGSQQRAQGLLTEAVFPPGWTVTGGSEISFFDPDNVWRLQGNQKLAEYDPYYYLRVVTEEERKGQVEKKETQEKTQSELKSMNSVQWLHPLLQNEKKSPLTFPDSEFPYVIFYEWDRREIFRSFYLGCENRAPPVLDAGYKQEIYAKAKTSEEAVKASQLLKESNPGKRTGGRFLYAMWDDLDSYTQKHLTESLEALHSSNDSTEK